MTQPTKIDLEAVAAEWEAQRIPAAVDEEESD